MEYTAKIRRCCCILLVVTIVHSSSLYCIVNAFYPNNFYQCPGVDGIDHDSLDHTHKSMTKKAISHVIRDIEETANIHLPDSGSILTQRQALEEILRGSDELDRYGYNEAANHFNGEQIPQSNAKLKRLKQQIIELSLLDSPYKYTLMRHLIGQSLHLIQDFYSNTDWTEVFKQSSPTTYYRSLGIEGEDLIRVDETGKWSVCISSPINSSSSTTGNILHGTSYMTSGYRSDQDVIKPDGRYSEVDQGYKGKCSHGGIYDSSTTSAPTGGINSESYNYWLSPKFDIHNSSAQSAIEASQAFLYSDIGLSVSISSEELLRIFGVGVAQHVSLLQTATLQELSLTRLWNESLLSSSKTWPWDVSHLYVGSADKYNVSSHMLYSERSLYRTPALSVSQSNILGSADELPTHSDLVIVTKTGLEESWDEDVIKKVLNQRNIRLTVFVYNSTAGQTAAENHLKALERLCKATGGGLFIIKYGYEVLDIMSHLKPTWETTHYVPESSGEVLIPIEPQQSLYLVINCVKPKQESHKLPGGSVDARIVLSTDYITILNITSRSREVLKMDMRLAKSIRDQCTVSTRSETKPVHVYPVQQGVRRQLFPSSIRVLDIGRVVVETTDSSVTPLTIGDSRRTTNFVRCLYEAERSEVPYTYVSEELSNIQQPDYVDLTLQPEMDYNTTIREYLDMQHISVEAPTLLPVNSTSLEISITNKQNRADFSFSLYPSSRGSGVTITPTSYSASHGEIFKVKLEFNESYKEIRPVTLLVRGFGDDYVEFHAAHAFQFISTDHVFYQTTTIPTTPTTTSRPTTSTPTTTKLTTKKILNDPTIPSTKARVSSTPQKPPVPTSRETIPNLISTELTLPAETSPSADNQIRDSTTISTNIVTDSQKSHIPNSLKTTSKVSIVSHRYKPPPGQMGHHFTLSFVVTLLVLITLIITVATGILLYHFYCKNPNSSKETKYMNVSQDSEIPITSL